MKTKKIITWGIAVAMLLTNTAFASNMYSTRGEGDENACSARGQSENLVGVRK